VVIATDNMDCFACAFELARRRRRHLKPGRDTLADWAVICDDIICSSQAGALKSEDPAPSSGRGRPFTASALKTPCSETTAPTTAPPSPAKAAPRSGRRWAPATSATSPASSGNGSIKTAVAGAARVQRRLAWRFENDGSLAGTFRLPSLAGAVLLQALRATACDLEPPARRWTGQPHPLQPARPGRPLRGVGAAGPVHHRDAGLLPVTALAGSGGGRRAQPRHHKSWLGPGQRMPRERAAPPMPPPSRASHPHHPLARRVPSGTGAEQHGCGSLVGRSIRVPHPRR
jgi:hypothetical protein